jgi:hypothetical protein
VTWVRSVDDSVAIRVILRERCEAVYRSLPVRHRRGSPKQLRAVVKNPAAVTVKCKERDVRVWSRPADNILAANRA